MVPKLFFFFLFLTAISNPQVFQDPEIDSLILSGTDNIINQDYRKAEKIFQTIALKYPKLPIGDIYLAANEISKDYDLNIPFREDFIIMHTENGLTKAEKLLEDSTNSLYYKYLMALAKGYSAYYAALNNNWLSALSIGLPALSLFKDCAADSTLKYEAYASIGTYLYWKSRKLESLNWLPFINDETEIGIGYLKEAVEHSRFNRHLAAYSLMWIFIDKGKPDSAVIIGKNFIHRYPGSRFFKWVLARAFEDINKEEAIRTYNQVLSSYKNPGILNEIILKHKMAQQYYFLGNRKEALKLCDDILSKKITDRDIVQDLELRLIRVREMQKELKKQ